MIELLVYEEDYREISAAYFIPSSQVGFLAYFFQLLSSTFEVVR